MLKKVLVVTIASILALTTLVGCGASAKSGKETLIISTWGLNEDKLWESLLKPFEEENNVKIVLETGNNSERLTKLKNNKNSNVDLVYLAESFAQQGSSAGIFETIDQSKIENIKSVSENSKSVLDNGNGVAYTLNGMGIIVSPKANVEIDSWDDLWSEELKGKIAIPDITTTNGAAMLSIAADKARVELSKDNGEAAFKEIEKLKPNVVKTYSKSSDLANMFASEEIYVAVAADFAFDMVQKNVTDAQYIVPSEGTYLNFNTININKNSQNKDLAYKFINYALSDEVQKRNITALSDAPVNENIEVEESEIKNLIHGETEKKSKVLDYNFINSSMEQWINNWNRIMN